jgi:hypothetical protein
MKQRLGMAAVLGALLLTSMPANAQIWGAPDRPPPGPSPRPGPPPGPPEPRRPEPRRIIDEDVAACTALVRDVLSDISDTIDEANDATQGENMGALGAPIPQLGNVGRAAQIAVDLCVLRATVVRTADPAPSPSPPPGNGWGWGW